MAEKLKVYVTGFDKTPGFDAQTYVWRYGDLR